MKSELPVYISLYDDEDHHISNNQMHCDPPQTTTATIKSETQDTLINQDPPAATQTPHYNNRSNPPKLGSAAFYHDMHDTIVRTFPFRAFAARYACSVVDVDQAFGAIITKPLYDVSEKDQVRISEAARRLQAEFNRSEREAIRRYRERLVEKEAGKVEKRKSEEDEDGGLDGKLAKR